VGTFPNCGQSLPALSPVRRQPWTPGMGFEKPTPKSRESYFLTCARTGRQPAGCCQPPRTQRQHHQERYPHKPNPRLETWRVYGTRLCPRSSRFGAISGERCDEPKDYSTERVEENFPEKKTSSICLPKCFRLASHR